MKKQIIFALLAISLLTGCTVGPNYKRPAVNVPQEFRGLTPEAATQPGVLPAKTDATSLGEQNWEEIFKDQQLQHLIRTALQQNYDVRIAASRILQAEALLRITRADQYPELDAGASISNQRRARTGPIPSFENTAGQISVAAAWELDFWGKYRRATQAARAELLAQEWARQAVISTLVADVAGSYFQLRELDLELEIARRTASSRTESLNLTKTLQERGLNTMLDVHQAEQLVYAASAQVPDIERQIEQQENAISILLGRNPGDVSRGLKLTEQPLAPEVPAGLPSSLLERRPDIRQAEQRLIAANARIGVAKAAYFPQITLTASGGFQSSTLAELFTGPAGLWSFGAALTQPIFNGGRIRSNVRLTKAQQEEALLVYQRTIQQAFREVSDGLVAYRKNQEFRKQQELLTQSAREAARLSGVRYRAGQTSNLEVLTNETNLFAAELRFAQAQLNERLALVQLYRALGGGWQQR
ncbi:MAG TPA: efflux transporter outer membrane subunit [Candidatus Acidoferrales bacterium]|nr:efflux transporter outer membrane subunit [Candidatus Acidoferrales bacterium]